MKQNSFLIHFARNSWFWFWRRLMDGFAPADDKGNYTRPKGLASHKILGSETNHNKSLYLLVGVTCPWCHRTLIVHKLKKLSKNIPIIYLKAKYETGEWVFEKEFHKNKTLKSVYAKSNLRNSSRATAPVLITIENNQIEILSNESKNIVSFLNNYQKTQDDYSLNLADTNSQFINLIDQKINNGVYKCGFARNQESYLNASRELFNALKQIDLHLENNKGDWVLGEEISLADVFLFPTIIRWELIYSKLFKCTEMEISTFKNIMKWRLNFFKLNGIAETCIDNQWAKDYYKALFPLNPNQIVPIQPSLEEIINQNISTTSNTF